MEEKRGELQLSQGDADELVHERTAMVWDICEGVQEAVLQQRAEEELNTAGSRRQWSLCLLRILLGTALAKNGKQGRHLKNSRQI